MTSMCDRVQNQKAENSWIKAKKIYSKWQTSRAETNGMKAEEEKEEEEEESEEERDMHINNVDSKKLKARTSKYCKLKVKGL